MKSTFDKHALKEILIKRAEGFFYSEEVFEYGLKENKKLEDKDKKSDDNTCESVTNIIEIQAENSLESNGENQVEKTTHKNNSKKIVSKNLKNKKANVYSTQKCDNDNLNFDEVNNENTKEFTLLKKKITTHYVPPDMSAIKMLLEIFGQEISSSNVLNDLSDDELINLKNEILNDIKNDN